MMNAKGREVRCQEHTAFSGALEHMAPATRLIDNGDRQPYWMCDDCAEHNIRNRGAVEYVKASTR